MTITRARLEQHHRFEDSRQRVELALAEALTDPQKLVRFFARYISWNGCFGSGVAILAGRIGYARRLFLDPLEPVDALADRSVYVASYFFDAARDEFDDRDTVHRDTHRCLAQAMLKGLIAESPRLDAGVLAALVADPPWMEELHRRTLAGYSGGEGDSVGLFRAMGYHLGSEVLADQEFSRLHALLQAERPALVAALEGRTVRIAGQDHNAFQWLKIHSGHGGQAEADHFDWALMGVERAFRYVRHPDPHALTEEVLHGFSAFAHDHTAFFTSALLP